VQGCHQPTLDHLASHFYGYGSSAVNYPSSLIVPYPTPHTSTTSIHRYYDEVGASTGTTTQAVQSIEQQQTFYDSLAAAAAWASVASGGSAGGDYYSGGYSGYPTGLVDASSLFDATAQLRSQQHCPSYPQLPSIVSSSSSVLNTSQNHAVTSLVHSDQGHHLNKGSRKRDAAHNSMGHGVCNGGLVGVIIASADGSDGDERDHAGSAKRHRGERRA